MVSKGHRNLWALSGVLFVALFVAGLVFGNVLSPEPYPSPFAPSAEIESYFTESGAAVRALGVLQILAAISLLGFAACVAAFVRRAAGEGSALSGLALGGGVLAAAFFLLSGLLSWALSRPVTVELLTLVRALHDLTFLAGGPAHVSLLGLFVGAGSIAASKTKVLPRWIDWVGIVAAVLSLLSVASMLWTPVTVLLPLGRLLSSVWIVAVSLVLVCGRSSIGGRR